MLKDEHYQFHDLKVFLIAFLCCFFFVIPCFSSTGTVARVTVRTRAKSNPNPSIWYRVPCDYGKVLGRRWRTLVIFGGRNCGGEAEVSGKLGWLPWADRYGIFLVAPGFKDDRYWEPQAWSGRALLTALAEIRKSYDIDTEHLLIYGYSAGSQAANLFAHGGRRSRARNRFMGGDGAAAFRLALASFPWCRGACWRRGSGVRLCADAFGASAVRSGLRCAEGARRVRGEGGAGDAARAA